MIKFHSYSRPVPLWSLCRLQKQVSELRDTQSAEAQLVNGISCMARQVGYYAKVLTDKGLCVTLIAAPCNLQSQYRSKLGCYLRDQLITAPMARNSLYISNLHILLAPHLRQGDLATPLYTDSCPSRLRQDQPTITILSTKRPQTWGAPSASVPSTKTGFRVALHAKR